jgi:hypothetical protein
LENGQRHRDGGLPAIEHIDGRKEWFVKGERHRDDGLPAIEKANGDKSWFLRGKEVYEDEAKAWHQAIQSLQRFRARVRRLSGSINVVGLAQLVKKRAFCEWHYAPDEVGGRVAKRRLLHVTGTSLNVETDTQ